AWSRAACGSRRHIRSSLNITDGLPLLVREKRAVDDMPVAVDEIGDFRCAQRAHTVGIRNWCLCSLQEALRKRIAGRLQRLRIVAYRFEIGIQRLGGAIPGADELRSCGTVSHTISAVPIHTESVPDFFRLNESLLVLLRGLPRRIVGIEVPRRCTGAAHG